HAPHYGAGFRARLSTSGALRAPGMPIITIHTGETNMFRSFAIFCGLALALALPPAAEAAAPADSWPARPVTWVVGYAAGGTTDIIARTLAQALGEQTGQTFVVENRTGANSNIGAEIVTRAAPDG